MNITILKTALEFLKLFFELLSKLVTNLAALARSRRRPRQQRAQHRSSHLPPRAILDCSPICQGANFAGTDDVLLRPVPEQQPTASYTTRPVLAKDLIRR
jgi:hypothetical protein